MWQGVADAGDGWCNREMTRDSRGVPGVELDEKINVQGAGRGVTGSKERWQKVDKVWQGVAGFSTFVG